MLRSKLSETISVGDILNDAARKLASRVVNGIEPSWINPDANIDAVESALAAMFEQHLHEIMAAFDRQNRQGSDAILEVAASVLDAMDTLTGAEASAILRQCKAQSGLKALLV